MEGRRLSGATLMAASTKTKPSVETALEQRTKIINRLRRLEGQVRGLQKMLEDERECKEILTQLSGARAALDTVGELILEAYLEDCQAKFVAGKGETSSLIEVVRLLRK
jgi:CsoR family transcriptional regulator, copper-sensing transcriptional repressor